MDSFHDGNLVMRKDQGLSGVGEVSGSVRDGKRLLLYSRVSGTVKLP